MARAEQEKRMSQTNGGPHNQNYILQYHFVPVEYSNLQAMPVLGFNWFLHTDTPLSY